jgi:Arc/MetJ-type ribon-helix-helix transcriptional regulator
MEGRKMMPVSEKVFVRLTKELATALDRYVEKRVRETPGLRLTRSDAIRTCLHRCLEEELHEVETLNAQGTTVGCTKEIAPHPEED